MSVIIGMDPHKRSATIEVVDERGRVLAVGRFGTDKAGYADMLAAGRKYADRVWAVEGCNGIGKHIAHRLVHDGETVLDVPAKRSAQVRVFATGNGRKTDPVDAHPVAMVALRSPDLVQVQIDADLQVLGMLADRRDELGRARTQTINRLHRLLLELLPGGAKKFLSAPQARALIATVKPRDIVGKTRRRLAVELISELEGIDKKIKAAEKNLKELVAARGSTLMELQGIGPSGAARLLADVADISRFADRDRFASWNGTAPVDASSGDQKRHRLSRAGNRRINRTLHIMAVVQLRNRTEGRAYFDAKKAAGKTSMEAIRALKRRLCNVVYARMAADQKRRQAADPGGQSGTTLQSSVTDLTPDIGPSDKPLPGPATNHPKPWCQRHLDIKGCHEREFGRVGCLVPCYVERARDPFRASDASAVVIRKEWQIMPRLYGPGHFTEDPYSQVVSPHGIPVDDLVAVLQKEIRRSRIDNAVLAAYEMFTTSTDVAQHLWRRLRLIAVEDVGMGLPLGPVLIDVLHRNFNATPGGDWMMACHAVRLLASAPKDRTSSEHADWVATKVALGEALVEVPDYAHCVHTRAGQELGRGLMQWWDNGAQVRDELPSADHRYREELIEIHRRDEAENGTAPPPSRWASATAGPYCD